MWKIGNVKINNRIVFAPMAGISNESFRKIIKSMNPGLIYSEMISNMGIIYNSKNTIDMLKINDEEKSIIMQALLEKRNKQLKENRPAEPVNELLEKIIKK